MVKTVIISVVLEETAYLEELDTPAETTACFPLWSHNTTMCLPKMQTIKTTKISKSSTKHPYLALFNQLAQLIIIRTKIMKITNLWSIEITVRRQVPPKTIKLRTARRGRKATSKILKVDSDINISTVILLCAMKVSCFIIISINYYNKLY